MTTTQHTPSTERTTKAICPPWCAGHTDVYQSWEIHTQTGRPFRYHGDQDRDLVHGVGVVVMQEEDSDRVLADPFIDLFVDMPIEGTAHLTPLQAINVARALLDAAEAAWLAQDDQR